MPGLIRSVGVSAIFLLVFAAVLATQTAAADDRDSIVITYKDGHHQSLAAAEIARIDLKAPAAIVYKDGHREKISAEVESIEFSDSSLTGMMPNRSHFIGKWEVGEGNGSDFYIVLEANGDARKSIGAEHGTWTLVDGEARIAWDDGWHDVIRKVGAKHEKLAFEPGKSFSDAPSNVTAARNTQAKPI
ncbi:MAG: hypothetical protein WAM79_17870 [Candidatus Sulfotelmatobacter sp.]